MAFDFSAFESAFPPAATVVVRTDLLAGRVTSELHVQVPEALIDFWGTCGAGYFGEHELFFFMGEEHQGTQDDALILWNSLPMWRDLFPPPSQGGPVFIAETCFGDQLGFRWDGDRCLFILFSMDLFDSFVLSESPDGFFSDVLGRRGSILEEEVLGGVKRRLGRVRDGMHYVPIVSPMVGGSARPDNYILGRRRVHLVDSIALFRSLHDL